MNLPFIKKPQNPVPTREYFFALEISHSIIKSAVWSVINDKPQVLFVSGNEIWDDNSQDSLIAAADKALTSALNHLDPLGKVEVQKVIFGLPPDWLNEEKIDPAKLSYLKALSHKLDLKPVGFVVTPEAAIKFVQATEGVPPTAILLGFWPDFLEVTLVRLGRVEGIHLVKRSPQLVEDVIEGLSRFSHVDMLPSRMLLYDSGLDLEEIKQILLAHPWQTPNKKLPFLHFPKVEILPADFTIRSIALAGGSEVARAIGLIAEDAIPVEEQTTSFSAQDLGFTENTDIGSTMLPPVPPPVPQITPITPAKPKFKLKFPHLPRPNFNFRFNYSLPIIIGVILAIISAALISAYWFFPKSTVTLFVTPKHLEHQFNITVGGSGLPAQSLEAAVSGDKTISATGSKLVGDKATGSVTIYNASDALHIPAGTKITSPSGLVYLLDSAVDIASGSAANVITGKANVTASKIGSDYNLSAGTQFGVDSYDNSVVAKNDTAFSGGTTRQVKAVSKDDITKLRTDLLESLKNQAKDQLMQKLGSDKIIISESINLQTVSENFDHKVDEEADSLTLKLVVKATGLAISKSEFQGLVDKEIKPLIPEGFSFDSDLSQTFSVKKAEKNNIIFSVQVTTTLLPQLDLSQISKSISGKRPSIAKDYLLSLPGVNEVDIIINPNLPGNLATLPHVLKNITVSVQSIK